MDFLKSFINLDLKNRYSSSRQPLMGFAILWIYMLHSGKTGNELYDAIRFWGWVGVDIFFFLSAIGLCYSLKRDDNITNFYKKRIVRILPTWEIVLLSVNIIGLICNHFLPNLPFYVPDTFAKCVTWYTGIGFWIADFVPGKGWFYEWYVPSLLMFYLFTPWLYKRKNKTLILLIIIAFFIGLELTTNQYIYTTHFFYQRIPIFILGILFYHLIRNDNNMYFNFALLVCLLIGTIFLVSRYIFGLLLPNCYIVLFVLPSALIMLTYLANIKYIKNVLSFYGGISLELYLIHIYRRPHYIMGFVFENKFLIILSTLFLCTIVAICLRETIKLILINNVWKKTK